MPKLRHGTYFPEWLLRHRRRSEQALVTVIAQAYVEGVSTRRVDDLAKAMGIEGISSSEVSRVAGELDGRVTEFRDRRLDSGPYRYVWIDALTQKVREGGRVVNVSAVIATAVNVEGRREIIGFDVITSETTEGWTTFLRSLVGSGPVGCRADHLRRSRRYQSRDRDRVRWGVVAEVSNPFHGQPCLADTEVGVADDRHARA